MLAAALLIVHFAGPVGDVVGEHAADRARIARHLHAVEAELRARAVGELSAELQEQRRRNLERLRTYTAAGEFPHNEDFPGERVPYFIDADGVPCAVGFLVIDSGFAAVAQEIHDGENNARLLAMTHPALPAWIAASGLTAAECARIQPAYCECGEQYAPVCGIDGITYTNKCVAETCAGVEVAYDGPCKGEDTTTGWPEPGTEADPGASSGETGSSSGESTSSGDAETTGTGGTTGAEASTGGSSGAATTGAAESTGAVTGDEPMPAAATDTDASGGEVKNSLGHGCRLGDGDETPLGLLGLLGLGVAWSRRRRP